MKNDWKVSDAKPDRQTVTRDWRPVDLELISGVRLREVRPVIGRDRELTEVFRLDWFDDSPPIEQIFQVTLRPGALSAWHGHAETTDRLYVAEGTVRFVLYDQRPESPTRGRVNEFILSPRRPGLLVVPPQVWHGLQNVGGGTAIVMGGVDHAYCYEKPDHWRAPADSPDIPFEF